MEPDLKTIQVLNNYTILGDLSFNLNSSLNEIEFMGHNQGLVTASEWHALAESVQYSGLRTMLSEDLFNSLCLDSTHCSNLVTGIIPAVSYNPAILNLPTAEQIKNKLMEEMNLNLWQ